MLPEGHGIKTLWTCDGRRLLLVVVLQLSFAMSEGFTPPPVGVTADEVLLHVAPVPFGNQNTTLHRMLSLAGYLQSPYRLECAHPFWYLMGTALVCETRTNYPYQSNMMLVLPVLPCRVTSVRFDSWSQVPHITATLSDCSMTGCVWICHYW